MNTKIINRIATFKPVLIAVTCALSAAASLASASAATVDDVAVPHVAVHYTSENLATDEGARRVYRQIVRAAETVCPDSFEAHPFVNAQVLQCRQQSIARALRQINSPHLAAVSGTSTKKG